MSTPSQQNGTDFHPRPTSTSSSSSSSSVPLPSLDGNNNNAELLLPKYPLLLTAAVGGAGNFVASPPPEPPLVISIPALAQIGSSCWDSLEIRRGFHRQTNDGTASQEHAKCQQHHRQIVVEGSGKETAAAAKEVAKPARQRCCRRYWIVLLLVLLVVAGLLAVASLLTNLYNSLSNELHQLKRQQQLLEWQMESRLQDRFHALSERAAVNRDRLSQLADQQNTFSSELDLLKRQMPKVMPSSSSSNGAKSTFSTGSSSNEATEKSPSTLGGTLPHNFVDYLEDGSQIPAKRKPDSATASDFVVYVNGQPVSGRKFLDNQRDFIMPHGRLSEEMGKNN